MGLFGPVTLTCQQHHFFRIASCQNKQLGLGPLLLFHDSYSCKWNRNVCSTGLPQSVTSCVHLAVNQTRSPIVIRNPLWLLMYFRQTSDYWSEESINRISSICCRGNPFCLPGSSGFPFDEAVSRHPPYTSPVPFLPDCCAPTLTAWAGTIFYFSSWSAAPDKSVYEDNLSVRSCQQPTSHDFSLPCISPKARDW